MTSSPARAPGAVARKTSPTSSVTRPATRGAVMPSTIASAASSRILSLLTSARSSVQGWTPRTLFRFPAQRALDGVELRREARIDHTELGLDDASAARHAIVGDEAHRL